MRRPESGFHVTFLGASIAPHQLTSGAVFAFFFIRLKMPDSLSLADDVLLLHPIKNGTARALIVARFKKSRRFSFIWFINFVLFIEFVDN